MELDARDRDRAITLIRELRDPALPDSETDSRLTELERLLRYPRVTDLLFFHEPELSDEEVIEEALRCEPYT